RLESDAAESELFAETRKSPLVARRAFRVGPIRMCRIELQRYERQSESRSGTVRVLECAPHSRHANLRDQSFPGRLFLGARIPSPVTSQETRGAYVECVECKERGANECRTEQVEKRPRDESEQLADEEVELHAQLLDAGT